MSKSVTFDFSHLETVTHVCDESMRGVVIGRMNAGEHNEYRVQWGIEKCIYHLKDELRPVSGEKQIGFHKV